MSTEKEVLRRVQDGLFHLQKGLTPFVEGRMKARHGANWLHYASRAAGSSPTAKIDAYGLLKTMLDNWRDVFDEAFGRTDKHKARNFASMALEARNAVSHLAVGLQDDEALRYLDSMHQLPYWCSEHYYVMGRDWQRRNPPVAWAEEPPVPQYSEIPR